MIQEFRSLFEQQGFVITSGFYERGQIEEVEKSLHDAGAFCFDVPAEQTNLLVSDKKVWELGNFIGTHLTEISEVKIFPVKAFILDKTPAHNWEIPWHQDLKIAVAEKRETPGYTDWSVHAGIMHVQPPLKIMEQLITARIHFDTCHSHNGAMRVIAGSHRLGFLSNEDMHTLAQNNQPEICHVEKGDLMFMKPLIVHDSPRSESPDRRRILHMEFGCGLSNGLQWHNLPVSSIN